MGVIALYALLLHGLLAGLAPVGLPAFAAVLCAGHDPAAPPDPGSTPSPHPCCLAAASAPLLPAGPPPLVRPLRALPVAAVAVASEFPAPAASVRAHRARAPPVA